ncbi:tubulin epsilon and delta complex protein 2 isoform X2 [Pseudonaja textilis]|uniref:tubulin epsilon and delta complex protein 2 isoform X2 n=1 Tax=Pseudonaja textilis TaxID=8673 RepID=UPI000EA91968|nr:tubulin epsilon and delta complex protein 2 isoform X2 [Pseudonaja textilis]
MLPADCAQRLVSLFTQALEDCTEQRTKLQQKIQQCRAVLGEWNSESENPVPEDAKTEKHEATEPSAEELKDLELLNKALEKALRLRSKFHQVPCETIKVSETSSKKPVSQSALRQPARNPKDKVPKTTEMSPVSRKPVASKKPTAYMLKAPYKTDAAVKRPPVKIPAGRSKTAGKKLGSSVGVSSPKWKLCAKTAKDPHGKVRVAAEPGLPLGCSIGPCHTTTPPRFAGRGDCEGTGLQAPDLVDPGLEALGGPYPLRTDPPRKGAKPPTSTFQQIGSSLKLPPPYQKAFSKLLEECQDLKTDPEAAVTKSQFLEKLQATFFSPTPAYTPMEVKQELVHLRDLHLLITQHMEAERPEALGENPTWDREYESLVTVQALQELIEPHLGKLDQMREALVSHAEFASLCMNDKDDTDQDSWGFCHASLGEQTCSGPDSVGPPRLLFYSSLDELKEMEALKLQVAMLDQKLQIQTAMETELLPLLEPGRLPESSRPSAIRAVYSLMCESGEHVPVLVKDEEVPC